MKEHPMFSHKIDEHTELRLLEEHHSEEFFALIEENRQYLREWLSWLDTIRSVDDVRRMIRNCLTAFANRKRLDAGIWYQQELVGNVGLDNINWLDRTAGINYLVRARNQGKGLVTKSCRALLVYAFKELGMNRIEIRCAVGNGASRRVAERIGLKEEGIMRDGQWLNDHFVNLAVYGMLASEWKGV